jgi:hypothetical protein
MEVGRFGSGSPFLCLAPNEYVCDGVRGGGLGFLDQGLHLTQRPGFLLHHADGFVTHGVCFFQFWEEVGTSHGLLRPQSAHR